MSLDITLSMIPSDPIPCECCGQDTLGAVEVFDANITHNLGRLAMLVGIYEILWGIDNSAKTTAREITDRLMMGIIELKENPDYYRESDDTDWGTYDQFVPWLERLFHACIEFPDAIITIDK